MHYFHILIKKNNSSIYLYEKYKITGKTVVIKYLLQNAQMLNFRYMHFHDPSCVKRDERMQIHESTDIMEKRMAFSFDIFPPKTDAGMEKLAGKGRSTGKAVHAAAPTTFPAPTRRGGNVGKNLEVLDAVKSSGSVIPITHFTCIGNTREGIRDQLQTVSGSRDQSYTGTPRRPSLWLDRHRRRPALCNRTR
jgi:hypothetical protein